MSAVLADVCTALKFLLKARVFHFCTILLMLIAAPLVEHAFASAKYCIDITRYHRNATTTLITDMDSCRFQAELFDRGIVDQMDANIFQPYIGTVTHSYNS